MTDAEYHGNFHLERIEESYFIGCQLPSLNKKKTQTSIIMHSLTNLVTTDVKWCNNQTI